MTHAEFVEAYRENRVTVHFNKGWFTDPARFPGSWVTGDPIWLKAMKGLACVLIFGGSAVFVFELACRHWWASYRALFVLLLGLVVFTQAALCTAKRWLVEWLLKSPETFASATESGWINVKPR
jgi:hypothetical protein